MLSTAGRPSEGLASGTPTAGSKTPIARARSRSDRTTRAVRMKQSPAARSMSSCGQCSNIVGERQADHGDIRLASVVVAARNGGATSEGVISERRLPVPGND
jgi:hypothetical protein